MTIQVLSFPAHFRRTALVTYILSTAMMFHGASAFLFTSMALHQVASFTTVPTNSIKLQATALFSSTNNDDTADGTSTTRRKFFETTTTAAAAAAVASQRLILPPPIALATTAVTTTIAPKAAYRGTAPMGLGAWAWGDSIFWGYDKRQDGDLREVFNYAVEKNLAFFDTAELYGLGRSETLLGNFRNELSPEDASKVNVATKFAALPFRTKPDNVVKACKASLKRLNPDGGTRPIDLYQIHFPNAWANEEYWDGLASCYEQGLVKAVGVSNYGVDAIRAVHAKLAERGIPLASNQIQLSLLYRFPIENGLLDVCKELDVDVLSYSPLALGFLTGKYNKDNRPTGPRKEIAKTLFDGEDDGAAFDSLITAMREVSANHPGSTLSQVAVNWTIKKGTVPIPGARSLKQAKQNLSALEWEMSSEELALLDAASSMVPAYISPDKSPFPKEDTNTKLKMFDS